MLYKDKKKVQLPDILDVLIAGGGPAGTAAGFRAKELGLNALVVDYDDILKRISDFGTGKTIFPSYGKGGDKRAFPSGGTLLAQLPFDPIPVEELVPRWKGFYREASIPAQVGVELVGLEGRQEGHLILKCYNHRIQETVTYRTRYLVLALGAGEPRRFDISGDTRRIATSLKKEDASNYVGGPACVIGGGLSAAEAVIALSNAKAEAGDETLVYWSYRGGGLPKVKKAISDIFFDAFVGNGNIDYLRRSEPTAVVKGPDGIEYLSIRVARKVIENGPVETVHYEFPKNRVVACIGSEPPLDILDALGVKMRVGPNDKDRENETRRVVVTPEFETQQPNVFLVGATLGSFVTKHGKAGSKYWETPDFSDSSVWTLKKYQDNIKASLSGGVRVIEAIKARIDGKAPEARTVEAAPSISASTAPPAAPGKIHPDAYLVRTYLDSDVEDSYPVPKGRTIIGRSDCDISLTNDALISHQHAAVVADPAKKKYVLEDLDSEHGTFLKLHDASHVVRGGALIVAGEQTFQVDSMKDGNFKLTHRDEHGQTVGAYALPFGKTVAIGRNPKAKGPDDDCRVISLAKTDTSFSSLHFYLRPKGAVLEAHDADSLNGTLVRLDEPYALKDGDEFVVGESTFLFELEEAELGEGGDRSKKVEQSVPRKPESAVRTESPSEPAVEPLPASGLEPKREPEAERKPEPEPVAQREPVASPAPAPEPGVASAIFMDHDDNIVGTAPAVEGRALLDIAVEFGVISPSDDWCLGKGQDRCGASAVEVIEGAEHLSEAGDDEVKAAAADPWGHDLADCENPCRFMCTARLKGTGTVKLRLMEEY